MEDEKKEEPKLVRFGGGYKCFRCNKTYEVEELKGLDRCPECKSLLIGQR